jgi:transmembrane sensor
MESFMDNEFFLLLAARNLSGEASDHDVKELEKLFVEDDSYRKKYELLKLYWGNKNSVPVDVDKALQKIILQIQNEKNGEISSIAIPGKRSGVIRLLRRFSKVAAILLVCVAGAYFIYRQVRPESMAKLVSAEIPLEIRQTAKGGKSTITLSDGTKVFMNADSRLKFPRSFSGSTREVYLSGEAFFNVAHNANSPFIIHADKINIKVLGTAFNVKSYPDDSTSETTLINGMIEVTLEERPDDRIILKPKEKLIVSNSLTEKTSFEIKKASPEQSAKLSISSLHYISKSDSEVVETSWLDNKLVFQNESFINLAAEIGRKYNVNIQFKSDYVKGYRFTGIFEKETIVEALGALQLTEKFNYKMQGTTITIY